MTNGIINEDYANDAERQIETLAGRIGSISAKTDKRIKAEIKNLESDIRLYRTGKR